MSEIYTDPVTSQEVTGIAVLIEEAFVKWWNEDQIEN